MNEKTYFADELIFAEGDYARTMYEVKQGTVGIFASYGTADQEQLATLGANEYFGEMGLVEAYPRSATAVALENDTIVLEIEGEEFVDVLKDQPDEVLAIMRQLSARIRETNEMYQEACQAVFEAIEAERAGKRRSGSLVGRLTQMLRSLVL